MGLDLASRTDLAAMAIAFPSRDAENGRTTYAVFARCYLNEAAVAEARSRYGRGRTSEGSRGFFERSDLWLADNQRANRLTTASAAWTSGPRSNLSCREIGTNGHEAGATR
jgi:hypothetical protein